MNGNGTFGWSRMKAQRSLLILSPTSWNSDSVTCGQQSPFFLITVHMCSKSLKYHHYWNSQGLVDISWHVCVANLNQRTYRNHSHCRLIIYQFLLLFLRPTMTLALTNSIGYPLQPVFVTSLAQMRLLASLCSLFVPMNLREHLVLDLFFRLKASCAIFWPVLLFHWSGPFWYSCTKVYSLLRFRASDWTACSECRKSWTDLPILLIKLKKSVLEFLTKFLNNFYEHICIKKWFRLMFFHGLPK